MYVAGGVGASNACLKKIMAGGVSGQPENPLDTPLMGSGGRVGYGVDRRPDVRWFESHFGKNFSLRNFGNSVYPACQCLSDETVKAVGPFWCLCQGK